MLKNIKLQFLSLVEYFRTFSWKKFLNNLKTYFSKPQNIITIVFAIVLLVGVIFPLATMVLDSFKVQSLTEAKTMNDSWNLSLKKVIILGLYGLMFYLIRVEWMSLQHYSGFHYINHY